MVMLGGTAVALPSRLVGTSAMTADSVGAFIIASGSTEVGDTESSLATDGEAAVASIVVPCDEIVRPPTATVGEPLVAVIAVASAVVAIPVVSDGAPSVTVPSSEVGATVTPPTERVGKP